MIPGPFATTEDEALQGLSSGLDKYGRKQPYQLAKVESPDVVWCEVRGNQLDQFEETADPEPEWPNAVAAAFGGLVQTPQG